MRISPVASAGSAVQTEGSSALQPRSFKMTTNANPNYESPPQPSIPDGNETPAADEVTQPLSLQHATIAKAKRALQVKEREIQAREQALAEKEKAPPDANSITLEQLKKDPIGVILGAGLTYDDLTKAVVERDDRGGPQLKAIEDRVKSVEEGFEKKLADRDSQAEQAALAEMEREATRLSSEGDTYELVRATKSVPKVKELIYRTYKKTGEVMDVSEALQLVEDELVKEYSPLTKLKKLQAEQPAPQATQQARPPMRTLTNRDTAQVPLSPKQRALAAFNGTLRR